MDISTIAHRHDVEVAHPHVWLLQSHKIGDNNQILALAETLGWPYDTKTIVRRENWLASKLIYKQMLGITLAGIDRSRSSKLAPPWPDLVISASRASEMVARWIGKMSGGRTRIVHIGRPKGPVNAFDLIVTTPQYYLPERKNVLNIELPLHRVSRNRLQASALKWQPQLSYLRRPYTVVLVGGNSGKLVLTREMGCQLGQRVNQLSHLSGGSVLVTSSARTPPAAFDELISQLTVPMHIYRWNDSQQDNPFYGYLALADQLVVTAESTSMLAEASATGKPVFIFDFQDKNTSRDKNTAAGYLRQITRHFKPKRFQRDIGNIHKLLIDRGYASWFVNPVTFNRPIEAPKIISCDLQRTTARVRQLFHK
ncbi:DUF1022 domain-containing protein [hydrothermal vent metagenome]|uniref:DUF1022 domain-containing protein n=1 Tax=hydrothermal vent metagenome TaxID=652676 RepID=A0A3B0YQJ3_9ZZZZ